MSLFPSAANVATKPKENEDKAWLQNKSFQKNAAKILNKLENEEKIHNKQVQLYLQEQEIKEPDLKRTKFQQFSEESESSSDGEAPVGESPNEKLFYVDKAMDKNNLYFGKPYKVQTPKFYRSSSNCVGLSSKLQIIFKKDKKRRKKIKVERYYHEVELDEQGDLDPDEFVKNKTETLNIKVRETPTNIEAWKELVDLQDKLGNKNVKFVTEKKISILDKAINNNPRNVELKLQRLRLKENILENCSRDWKDLVFQHPANINAWEAYIESSKKDSKFTVQKSCKIYAKCFETLSSLRNQNFQSNQSASQVENDIMKMFRSLVQFLVEAGRNEQVLAILILLMEINVRTTKCTSVSNVKDFYNSGESLLGQEGSKGWEIWNENMEKGGWVIPQTQVIPEDIEFDVDFEKNLNENWILFESQRGMSQLLPWRCKEDCDDEERKISWEEIGGLIFFVHEKVNKLNLVNILVNVVGSRLRFTSDTDFMCAHPCQFTHAYQSNVPLGCILHCDSVVCDDACSFGAIPKSPHHEFLCLFFDQLCNDSPLEINKDISLIYLSYLENRMTTLNKSELKQASKEARKVAKNLLKNDPMNFKLWNKFARIEFFAGRTKVSQKIFYNSLTMCKEHCDIIMLCSSFCELFYEIDNQNVLRVLTALGDDAKFSEYFGNPDKILTGVVTLRVNKLLSRQCEELSCLYKQKVFDNIEDCPKPSLFILTIYCYILFLQLTKPIEVNQKLKNFIEVVRKEKNEGAQANIDLITLHSLKLKLTSKDYKHCNLYRNFVLSAIQDCPNHSPFAVQLCKVEVGSSITSVARRIFSSNNNKTNSFFSIYFELLRLKRSNFEDEIPPRIRNLLERSTHKNNILMWRLYSKYAKNRKDVLLRASANCPWSKSIACDRILTCDETEIDSVLKFMRDKGIRVRTPIEEIKLLMTM